MTQYQAREIQEWELSTDKLWDVQQGRKALERRIDWTIAGVTVFCAVSVSFKGANDALRQGVKFIQGAQQTVQKIDEGRKQIEQAIDKFAPDWEAEPRKGEQIAGYEVTSLFGPREAPTPGASNFHRGLDLATPVGVQIYAIGQPGETVKVECKEDSASGKYARVTVPSFPGQQFDYLHLSKCAEGNQPAGSVIALTGDTGVGTAEHLHIGRRLLANEADEHRGLTPVPRWVAFWSLTGSPPQNLTGQTATKTGYSGSVYKIYSGKEIGTAFAIGPNELVTNYHAIRPSDTAGAPLFVRDSETNEQIRATIAQKDPASDLAILKTEVEVTPLPTGTAQVGDVTIPGNGQNKFQQIQGRITNIGDRLEIAANLQKGFSGSPIIQGGKVVGIASACKANGDKCTGQGGYAIKVEKVKGVRDANAK